MPKIIVAVFLILIFLILIFFIFDETVVEVETIYILPLGDSITQGGKINREEYTYRFPLFCMLKDAGIDFDFIGSLKTGLHKEAKWPDYKGESFDLDHEGHYGWKTGMVRNYLEEWMKAWAALPDIVLMHLGTNDQNSTDYNQSIVTPIKDMVKMLRRMNPKVVVLVGHLNFNSESFFDIREQVEKMALEITTPESLVITVHHYQNWNEDPKHIKTDTFDWAHPNPQGQHKMAEKWFKAMLPFISDFSEIK
jgi:hypothetical protein